MKRKIVRIVLTILLVQQLRLKIKQVIDWFDFQLDDEAHEPIHGAKPPKPKR